MVGVIPEALFERHVLVDGHHVDVEQISPADLQDSEHQEVVEIEQEAE